MKVRAPFFSEYFGGASHARKTEVELALLCEKLAVRELSCP